MEWSTVVDLSCSTFVITDFALGSRAWAMWFSYLVVQSSFLSMTSNANFPSSIVLLDTPCMFLDVRQSISCVVFLLDDWILLESIASRFWEKHELKAYTSPHFGTLEVCLPRLPFCWCWKCVSRQWWTWALHVGSCAVEAPVAFRISTYRSRSLWAWPVTASRRSGHNDSHSDCHKQNL